MKDVQVVLVVEEAPHIPESIFKGPATMPAFSLKLEC